MTIYLLIFVSVISKGSDEKYTPKYQYLGQYIYQCQNLQPQKRRNYSNKEKKKKCGFSLISIGKAKMVLVCIFAVDGRMTIYL